MQLNLTQFLGAMLNATGVMSMANGTVHLESGDTFKVAANIDTLHTVLSDGARELQNAGNLLAPFTESPPDAVPFWEAAHTQMNTLRQGLESIGAAHSNLNPDDARRARIAVLEMELRVLRAAEESAASPDEQEVRRQCREMKSRGQQVQAVKYYRSKMGCGLREAHDVVMSL